MHWLINCAKPLWKRPCVTPDCNVHTVIPAKTEPVGRARPGYLELEIKLEREFYFTLTELEPSESYWPPLAPGLALCAPEYIDMPTVVQRHRGRKHSGQDNLSTSQLSIDQQ